MNPTKANGATDVAAATEPNTGSVSATRPDTFIERALPLIARGFSIIPLAPKSKSPVAGVGALSRSGERTVVEAWARLYPDANAGICADENFTLLETDDEKTFREKIRDMTGKEIPTTLRLGSGKPNRGCWVYQRTPACGNDCLEVPGLFEFRNRNQYVAAPGSIHPEGYIYRWLDDVPVVAMPAWLVSAVKELDAGFQGTKVSIHQQCGAFPKLKQAYLLRRNPADLLMIKNLVVYEGERHYTLVSLAGLLHDGERDAAEIAEILQEVQAQYFSGCKSEEEIRRIARDVVRREPCHFAPRIYFGGKGWSWRTRN